MKRRDAAPPPPPRGGDEFIAAEVGPLISSSPIPAARARGQLIPVGDGEGLSPRPAPVYSARNRSSLLPTAAEIQELPRSARDAFTARCFLRVPPDSRVATLADVARVLVESATIDTPLTAQLRCIRRDFARLKKLARTENWTDDTPVASEVFGPLWPPGLEPKWVVAKE